jgi:hypothetical protein
MVSGSVRDRKCGSLCKSHTIRDITYEIFVRDDLFRKPSGAARPSSDALTHANGADARSDLQYFSRNLKPWAEGERQLCLVLTGDIKNIGEVYPSCVHFDSNALWVAAHGVRNVIDPKTFRRTIFVA